MGVASQPFDKGRLAASGNDGLVPVMNTCILFGSVGVAEILDADCGDTDVPFPVKNTFIHFGNDIGIEFHPLQRSVTDPTPNFPSEGIGEETLEEPSTPSRPSTPEPEPSTPSSIHMAAFPDACSEGAASVEGELMFLEGGTPHWHVDGRRLKGKDTHMTKAVQLCLQGRDECVEFIVSMYPKAVSTSRGGSNFRASNGVGTLQIKCNQMSENSLVLCLTVGGDIESRSLMHDFGASPVAAFPGEWDFQEASTRSDASPIFIITLVAVPLADDHLAAQATNVHSVLEVSSQVCNTPVVWTMPASAWTPADAWACAPWSPMAWPLGFVPPLCSHAVPMVWPPNTCADDTELSPFASPNVSPRTSPIESPWVSPSMTSSVSESNDSYANIAELDYSQYGPGRIYAFTIRRANDFDLGLDVDSSDCGRVLLVRDVAEDGAVAAWNLQCDEGPSVGRMVLPGDKILSVNGESSAKLMLIECRRSLLLKLVLQRGDVGPYQ
jgi:hypothetical protein